MLDIVRPPTDNLYKFIAIAGLVVFTSGIYLLAQAISMGEDAVDRASYNSVDVLVGLERSTLLLREVNRLRSLGNENMSRSLAASQVANELLDS
ncbi:MAG: hypothetical protein AAFQ53_13230, partial [Bacteroidota bacterium]